MADETIDSSASNAISRRDVLKGAAAGAAITTGFALGLRGNPASAQGKGPPDGVPGPSDHAGAPAVVNSANAPDTVLYNGKITTLDDRSSVVEAIAIRDGKILATGKSGPIRALARPQGTQVIDLQGRRALPGLIDGHLHGMRNSYHCFTQTVRLDRITSRDDALGAYATKAAELPDGYWIWTSFGGWNVNQLDTPVIFTFGELSSAAPNNPVWITGSGFTGPRVNQATLDALGLSAGSPGVQLDASGQPTGLLTAPATGLANAAILAHLDEKSMEERADCLADFVRESNRLGLTAWKDAGGNRAPWGPTGEIGFNFTVREPTGLLYRTGGLNARIAYHDMSNYQGFQQVLLDTRNSIALLGDDMLRYLGPGEDTMATASDYHDYTRYCASKRLCVETHVGNHNAILSGFEAANEVYPIAELNWMIGHPANNTPTDEQLSRAEALGGIGHSLTISSVRNGATGPRYRSTMEADVKMCLASDAMNVAPWAPLQTLFYVATGQTLLPGVSGVPEAERLTREQALRHMTKDAAWSIFMEDKVGSLEVGKYADLIVLTDDYFTVPDEDIYKLTSVLTIVDGRVVYGDGPYSELDPGPNPRLAA